MHDIDPYDSEVSRYECVSCGTRTTGENPGTCPDCGADTRNIAVPRE